MRRNWILIDCCLALERPADEGGGGRGEILLGSSSLGSQGCAPVGCPGRMMLVSGCCALKRSGHNSNCRAVMFLALRNRWMVSCGEVGMDVPLEALNARMTNCAVGGKQSQPFVSLSALLCSTMMGRRALAC